jgi:serine/threonine-protein kinase PknK
MSDAFDPRTTDPGQVLGVPGIGGATEIGRGGFGTVYRADEIELGRTVAVKVLSGNLDEAGRVRFDRERRAMGTLSGHPNIVTVYRSGYTTVDNAYLVMEYLAPGSLSGRLEAYGPLSWPEVLTLGVQLAGALETAHRAGVLHRDIKPGNILLSNLGSAKLCDFGIARLQGAFETRSATVTASLAHAPPEVVNGQRPDARSDVYSLASTLYELVTGHPPFVQPTDESMMQILIRIGRDPVPRGDAQQLPAPMFAAISAAMAKEPADRPATAEAFGELLVQAQQQLGLAATPIPIIRSGGVEGGAGGAAWPSRSGGLPVAALRHRPGARYPRPAVVTGARAVAIRRVHPCRADRRDRGRGPPNSSGRAPRQLRTTPGPGSRYLAPAGSGGDGPAGDGGGPAGGAGGPGWRQLQPHWLCPHRGYPRDLPDGPRDRAACHRRGRQRHNGHRNVP